jgi:hypothetical protein
MADRVWKIENEGAQGGPRKLSLAGYEKSAAREMKATKVLEDLKQEDLQAISAVIHDFLHSEE